MSDPRRQIGTWGEQAAARHLQGLGWRVLERNARTAYGEIDLIALDGAALVFVEVKSRRAGSARGAAVALESIGPRKRLRVRRLARAWLADHAPGRRYTEIRFDAVAVAVRPGGAPAAIEHLEAAF